MPPWTAKGSMRRQQVLKAAGDIMLAEGFRALTHRRVAEAAGVPLGTTTYYFTDRADLMRATVGHFLEREQVRRRGDCVRLLGQGGCSRHPQAAAAARCSFVKTAGGRHLRAARRGAARRRPAGHRQPRLHRPGGARSADPLGQGACTRSGACAGAGRGAVAAVAGLGSLTQHPGGGSRSRPVHARRLHRSGLPRIGVGLEQQ